MFRHALLPLLVVLLTSAALQSVAVAQQPESIADIQITSVSGCVDQPPVTVNCSVATTTLLVQTAAGFPASVDWSWPWSLFLTARLGDYSYFHITTPWLNTADASNTSFYINISASAYYPHITGQLISLSFIDYYSAEQPQSAPFAGFSYKFEGSPTLTSIGGCDGSGQATLNCVPDSSVIELTGSGFLWYGSGYGVQLNIGNETSWSLANTLQVVNDSYATLSLSWIYTSLLKPQHYAGVLLSFNLTSSAYGSRGAVEYSYTTNSLQISFVPLPTPRVEYWLMTGCNETTAYNISYTGCRASVSQLYIYGSYLYDVQVSVGGVTCVTSSVQAGFVACTLPSFDFDPSVAYDVVVYNDAGNSTLSGVVQYTSAPTLISIDPCIDRGEAYLRFSSGVQCPPGTILTLRGSRFPTADTVTVVFTVGTRTSRQVNVTLLNTVALDSATVTATLPMLDSATAAAVFSNFGYVQLLFTTGDVTTATNALLNRLYQSSTAPNITSVSSASCDSLSPLQLANCRAMAAITVVGTNLQERLSFMLGTSAADTFLNYNFLLPSNHSFQYSPTNASFVFELEYFDANTNTQLQPGVAYTLYVVAVTSAGTWEDSNAFRLSLTYDTAADQSASSDRLSSGAVAGIVIAAVVAALVLALVIVWLVRRQLSSKPSGGELAWSARSGGQGSSEDYKDVELSHQ